MLDESRDMQTGAGTGTGGAVAELKAAGKDAVSTAKETVSELKEQMTERATEGVESRKSVLADSLSSVVNALRAAERSLREDNQTGLADYSSSIASYVERSSGYVRDNDMNGLMSDLQRVGRENTTMFMGGSFAAGAALGRFLRASAPEPETALQTESVNATSDTRFGSEALS
ncbi:MAG TPA: hypothetical protein VF035_01245 [Longimicrobiales bacterium]